MSSFMSVLLGSDFVRLELFGFLLVGFSHSFSDLKNILQNSKNFDVVIGSRYIPGGGSNGWDFKRKLLSSYANKLSRVLLRSKINDMTSGFRSYSSEALNEINYFSTKSDGYSFQIEMTIRSIEKKLSITDDVALSNIDRYLGDWHNAEAVYYVDPKYPADSLFP